MKSGQRGVSLIEIMAVIGILGALAMTLFQPLTRIQKRFADRGRMVDLQSSSTLAHTAISRYFSRAMAVVFNQSGTSVTPYSIFNQGSIVLDADLTPCDSFDPANSNTLKKQVEISCCSTGLSMTAATPSSGPMVINSACSFQNGLSVVVRGASGIESSTCYEGYFEMNVVDSGLNRLSGNRVYTLELFANAEPNVDVTRQRGAQSIRWATTGTLGNTAQNMIIACE